MSESRVPGRLPTLLLCLLAGLQQAAASCSFVIKCPEGLTCCDDYCCQDPDTFSSLLRIFVITFLFTVSFVCICGFLKHFCRHCREPEQYPPLDHVGPLERPSLALPERVGVSILEPPPPYNEVILKPVLLPTEPPPPYSFRPEEHAGVHQGMDSPTF